MRAAMALNNNNKVKAKPKNRTPPRKMTWASWSSGMSSLSHDSEGQQFASAFADTHIQSVCVLDIDSEPYSYRMTQIVCTIGPASQDASILMKMSLSGGLQLLTSSVAVIIIICHHQRLRHYKQI